MNDANNFFLLFYLLFLAVLNKQSQMHYRLIIILCFSFVTLTACNKVLPVTACVEVSSSSINAGDSITFTSCSENEWSYIWEISGPDSAVENDLGWSDRIFTHPFDTPGLYQVKLTTFSDFSFLGDSASDSTTFTVN